MVLGILTAVAACPAIIGTTEAIRYSQRQNQRDDARSQKHNLHVSLLRRSAYSQRFDGAPVVLKDNKLWVDTAGVGRQEGLHPFTGYFLPYPGMQPVWRERGFRKAEGMVTTISDDPPFLNWVYVDKETHEVKYGVRDDTREHLCGPFDATKMDRRLTFEGWEGFVAVEEEEDSGLWAVYFDVDDDGLRGDGRIGSKGGTRMLALEVWRREMRVDREDAVEERAERIRAREEHDSSKTDDSSKTEDTTVS